jgi:hypothetical protein
MAKAVRAFIERQGAKVPIDIEPILIAGNPGLHIESVRPAVKVIMIDGVKSFVSGLATANPVLKVEAVHEFTERIINPRLRYWVASASRGRMQPASQENKTQPPQKETSRARAIFNAAEEAKPFNPADFDFAMVDEEAALETLTASPSSVESSPAQALPGSTPPRKRLLGMTTPQLMFVGALAAALLCILAVFAYLFFFSTAPLLP